MGEVILTMSGIDKSFPGVHALDHVDFELKRGEVHALMGENGAGKSTLMKVLTGIYTKDSGTITFEGKEVEFHNTHDAQEAGIVYINADCAYMSTDVDVLNILTDQEYLGYKTGTYAGEALGEGAKVVMIAALEGNQANTDRQRGFEKAIEENGLEVVATGNHDWDTTLSQQTMAEILNSGVEFDGVLVSQCAENAFEAFDAAGVPYPKFIGFGDTGAYMQKMLDVNKDEVVTKYIVLSNPPGVGATAFNFALNLYEGKELKDGVFAEGFEDTHQIWIQSKVCYTDEDVVNGTQIDGKSIEEYANSYEAGDSITFWLTKQEVADTYFN